jgi:hypothetical protein
LVIQAHVRHLNQKLAHRRSVAVEQARALGLLASSARRPGGWTSFLSTGG